MTTVPNIPLNDGTTIPQLGFGVFQVDPAETKDTVLRAFDVGYRHIDTAEMYENERGVGEAVRELGLDRLDLFLIHWPLPTLYDGDYVSTWQALEGFQREGLTTSIGVSNFQVAHLEGLAAECEVVPAVNQIELHPYLLNEEVDGYGREHGIVTEAWSPIAQGAVLGDPAITAIAERLGRTPAQIVLRWHVERGNVVFPKSTTPARIEENFALFDFELEPA